MQPRQAEEELQEILGANESYIQTPQVEWFQWLNCFLPGCSVRVALPAFVACEPGPPSPPRVGPMPLLPGIAVETVMSRCTTEVSAPMLPVPRGPSSWENVTGCLFVPSLLSTQGVLAHEASPSTLFGGGHIEEGFSTLFQAFLLVISPSSCRASNSFPDMRQRTSPASLLDRIPGICR